jgi:FixJ family two-component response regulator
MTATVHVVDNDDGVRNSVRFRLEVEGLAVRAYASAASLLAADLPSHGCVLSDVNMPGISGPQLQRMLAERGILLPFVFMSGCADGGDTTGALEAGATILKKPFMKDALLDAIRRALLCNAEAQLELMPDD